MADSAPFCFFKETRINLEPSNQNSTVNIRLPPINGAPSRISTKRPLPTDVPLAEDENDFKHKYLATTSSIYHRQHHKSPRSFLWRVLEDTKVIQLRVVDLCKQEKQESPLILRLNFPVAVKPSCITFSDAPEHDVLNLFVVTDSNHLYTATLRPEFFKRRSSTEDNVSDWTKAFLPNAFSLSSPHRMIALTSVELLVSLSNGTLLRLQRNPGGDSSSWRETVYNERGWTNSIRSIIPYRGGQTIKVGQVHFQLSAIVAMATSTEAFEGGRHAFTVSLDHKIRAWNLENGKIVYMGDMLGVERAPNEMSKFIIDAAETQLLKVHRTTGGREILVTYSPVRAGEFKFWNVIVEEDGSVQLEDIFPGAMLIPPPPTTDIWTMADFAVVKSRNTIDNIGLWLLWKNNITYRTQMIEVSKDSELRLKDAWRDTWAGVAIETLVDSPLPTLISTDAVDPTQKWLEFIFYPGRFTTATLETALAIYERGLGNPRHGLSRTAKPLSDRMCSIVASTAALTRTATGHVDFDNFRAATDTQWRRFYRLVLELDKHRGEALSLCFDENLEMAWIVTVDGLSAIRDCTSLERLWHSPESLDGQAQVVSTLISAAASFRESFSDTLHNACNIAIQSELFYDPLFTDAVRLQSLYEKCGLVGQIGDDDYAQLLANLGGSFKDVTIESYDRLVGAMTIVGEEHGNRLERLPLATFGFKTVVKGVQEMIELYRSVCVDQLVLLIFIENEVDKDEEGLQLDSAEVFRKLLDQLQRIELLAWLAKTQISVPTSNAERSNSFSGHDKDSSLSKKGDAEKTITAFEAVISHLLGMVTNSGESTAWVLMDLLMRICTYGSEFLLEPRNIQGFLLTAGRPDKAMECMRFADQEPFSTYIQGRVYLANKDISTAAIHFKRAAFGLSSSELAHQRGSAGLLDEVEKKLLHAGLPKYYSHIVSLFDAQKHFSYAIDFARLGLQFAVATDVGTIHLRTELLSRLFSAAVETSRFEVAYTSLALFTDHALLQNSLRRLIFSMCESNDSSQLIDFPFLGLHDAIDTVLDTKCHSIVDVNAGAPYHKILYAWRIRRNDFRGAAAVSLERLQRLQQSGDGDKFLARTGEDILETPVTRQYLTLINALSCVNPTQQWIFQEPVTKKGLPVAKRKVVTIEDVRREYQEELDRIAAIENGQFPLMDGENQMDIA